MITQNLSGGSKLNIEPKPYDPSLPWKTSASQHDTYTLCKRKWAFTYISGIRSPMTPQAALGDSVHKVLESWLLTGKIDLSTHIGKIAAAGFPYLPLPGSNILVEKSANLSFDGGLWGGRIDLIDLSNQQIIDHKTCGTFRYQKTPAMLAVDAQAVGYGYWATQEFGWKNVKQKWIYYLTKGQPEARITEASFSAEQLADAWGKQEELARSIVKAWKEHAHPLETESNYDACDALGGCYFRAVCEKYKEKEPVIMTNPKLLEAIKNRNSSTSPKENTTEVPQQHVGINPPAPATAAPVAVPRKKKETPDTTQIVLEQKQTVRQETPIPISLDGFTLYVNCLPTKNSAPVQMLYEVMRPAAQIVEEETGVRWELTDYGKGPTFLAVAFEKYVIPGLTGNIYLDRFSNEGKALLSVLENAATAVIKGF